MADANVDSTQQAQDAQTLDNLTSLQQADTGATAPTGGTADATVTTSNPPAPDTPSLYNDATGTYNNQANLEAAGTNSLLDTTTFTNDGRTGAANESPTIGSGVTFGTEVNAGETQLQYTVTNENPTIQGSGTNGTQNTVGGAQGAAGVAATTEAAATTTTETTTAPTADAPPTNTTPEPTLNPDGTSPTDPTVDPLAIDPTPQEPISFTQNPDVTVGKDVVSNGTGTEGAIVHAGETLDYTITVSNEGNTTLTNVTVTDAKLSDTHVSAIEVHNGETLLTAGTDYTIAGDVITFASLDVAAQVTVTYTFTVDQDLIDAGGTIDNVVLVASTEDVGGGSDETDNTSTPISQNPDVTVGKDVVSNGTGTEGAIVHAGETLDYTITVSNEGNTTLTNVTVTDAKLSDTHVSAIEVHNGETLLTAGTDYTIAGDVITFASLDVAAQVTVTYTFTVDQDLIDAGGTIDNVVLVASTEDVGGGSDETDNTSTPISQNPDVTVGKDVVSNGTGTEGAIVHAGETLDYTITVSNEGNTTLTNVTVTDAKLSDTHVSAIEVHNGETLLTAGTDYTIAGDVITFASLDVAAQVTVTYTFTVDQDLIDAGGTIDNVVLVASTEDVGGGSDETDNTSTLIYYSPELTLTKSAVVTDIGGTSGNDFGGIRSSGTELGGTEGKIDSAGDRVAYTLTASNAGNTTLHNVKVFDAMFNQADDQSPAGGHQISVTIYGDINGTPTVVSTGPVTVESIGIGADISYFVSIPTLAVGQYAKINYLYEVTDVAIKESSQPVATSIFESTSDFRSNEPLSFEVGGKVAGSVMAYTDDDDIVNPYNYSYDYSSEKQELFVNSDNTGRAIGVGAGVMSGMRSGTAADHDHIRVDNLEQGNTTGFRFSVTNATAVEIAFQAQYGSADTKFNGSIVIHKDGTFDLYHITSSGDREPLSGNQREWLTVEQEAGPGGAQNIIHTIAFRPDGQALDFFDFWVVGHESRNNEVQIKVVDIELEKPGVIENTAFATSNEDVYDASKVDQYASYQINVAAGPDLELTKSAVVTDIGGTSGNDFGGIRSSGTELGGTEGKIDSAGDRVAYTLTASNAGNTTLHNVKVFDAMFNQADDQSPAGGHQISVTIYDSDNQIVTSASGLVNVQSMTDAGTNATSYYVNVPTLDVGQYAKINYVYVVTSSDIDNFNNSSGLYSLENKAIATADEDVYSSSKVDQIASYDIGLVHGGESDLEVFKSAVVDSNGDTVADYTFDSSGDLIKYTITVMNRGEITTEDTVRVYDAMFEFANNHIVLVNGVQGEVHQDGSQWYVEVDPIAAKDSVELVYDYVVTNHDISGSAKSLISLLDGASPRGPLGYGPFQLKENLGTVLAYQDIDNQKLYDLDFDKTEVRQLYVNTDNTGTAIGVDAGVMAGDRNGYRDHLLLNFNDGAPVTSTSISFTNATALEVAFKAGYAGTTTTGSVTISNTGAVKEFNAGGSSLVDITSGNQLFDLTVVNGPGGAQNRIYTITFQSPDATLDYFDFWVVGSNNTKNFNEVQLKVVDVTLASPSSIENTAIAVVGSDLPSSAPTDQIAKYNVDYATGVSVSDLLIEANEIGNQFDIASTSLVDGDGSLLKYEIAGGVGSEKQGIWGKLAIDSTGHYSYFANSNSANELGAGDIGLDTFVVNISGQGVTSQKIVRVSLIGANDADAQTVISLSEDDLAFGGVLPTTEVGREYLFKGLSGSQVSETYKGNFDYVASGDHGQLYLNSKTGEYQYVQSLVDDKLIYNYLSAGINESIDSFTVVFGDNQERIILVNAFGVNDAPTISLLSTTTFTEDAAGNAVGSVVATYSTADAEGSLVTVTLSDTTNYALGTGANAGKVLLTQAGLNLVNAGTDLPAFTLTPNDGTVNGVAISVDPSVTPVNDAPTISLLSTTTFTEDAAGNAVGSVVATYSTADAEGSLVTVTLSDTTNYALGTGANAGKVLLTQAGLNLVNAGTDLPAFTLTPNDGTVNGVAISVDPSVTPVNDAPTISLLSTTTFTEDAAGNAVGSVVATYSTADAEGSLVTVTLSDTTNYALGTGANAGKVLLTQAGLNLVNAGTDLPAFTLTPNDGTVNGVAISVDPSVTPVNDAPTISLLSTTTFTEDAAGNAVGSVVATYSTADAEGSLVTVTLSDTTNYALGTGANAGKVLLTQAGLNLVNAGTDLPAFTLTPNDGTVNGVAISVDPSVTPVNDAPTISLLSTTTFTEDAAGNAVGSVVATYSTADAEGSLVTVTLSDTTNYALGTGANAGKVLLTQAGLNLVNAGTDLPAFTLTPNDGTVNGVAISVDPSVTPVNDAPTISLLSTTTFTEDAAGNAVGSVVATYSTADAEGSLVTVTLSDTTNYALGTGANAGKVLLTQAGLNLVNAGTDLPAFTLTPNDGTVNGVAISVDPSVTPVNDAPTISLLSTTTFTEDAAGNAVGSVVATYSTADAEGSLVTVTLSDTTNYALGTGANAGKVLLTQAGLNLVNAGTDLPAFTLTPNDGTVNGVAISVDPSVTPVNDAPGYATITRSGNTLTASVSDSDGVVSPSYVWYFGGIAKSGITGATYTLTTSEQNNSPLVYVVATYTGKGAETATSPTYLVDPRGSTLTQQPISLDLNGDGVHYISSDTGVTYDYNHDGIAESTAWVAPEDGLLAVQKDDGTHNIVFSTQAGETDLQGLAKVYDSNKDGVLDKSDADFAKFGVWQDADSDGIVDNGEFLSLADRGITSLSLTSDGQVHFEANGDVIVYGQTTYTTSDGQLHIAEDVGFAVSDVYEPLDIATIIANADAIESITHIDQLADTASSSSLMVELGGQTYEIATLAGHEAGTEDILSQFVGSDTSANLLTNKSWTDVIDISSDHGGPGSIIAAGGTLNEGNYANGEGDWTVIINSGDAKVDASNNQITFASESADNSVTIITADGASHDINNVDKIQWHG